VQWNKTLKFQHIQPMKKLKKSLKKSKKTLAFLLDLLYTIQGL